MGWRNAGPQQQFDHGRRRIAAQRAKHQGELEGMFQLAAVGVAGSGRNSPRLAALQHGCRQTAVPAEAGLVGPPIAARDEQLVL